MAAPKTLKFQDFPVYVEFVPSSGNYQLICGITSRGISRKTNLESDEIPSDCTDESLPAVVSKTPKSKDISISGSGKYARQSHKLLWDWWNTGSKLNVRIGQIGAITGEISAEEGAGYLTQLDNSVDKGVTVTADLTIEIDGATTILVVP